MNLGALDRMNNFLDLAQKTNVVRQGSEISQRTKKILNHHLPSLSEHIQKTQMLQSLECYDASAPGLIKESKLSPDDIASINNFTADSMGKQDLPAVRLHKIN